MRGRVIIIGGGIGGLSAAIALRKVGIEAHVYERALALREVGAGIGIMANALQALDTLGLGDAVRSQALAAAQGGLRDPTGKVLVAMPMDDLSRQAGAIAVMHRAELLAELSRHVDPESLHLDCECVGFTQDREGVTARFRSGEEARGAALIGADGLRSLIRTELFGDQPIHYAGYTAWRSAVKFESPGELTMTETWGRGRRFGIVPMSRGRVYWFATLNAIEGERDAEGKSRDRVAELFRGWHQPIEALIAASQADSILRNDVYDMEPLPHWSDRRATLMGDAAHPMTPNLGQGACQAIEDAIVLAACLKTNATVEGALFEYERRRMARTKQIVLSSRRLGAVAQAENAFICLVRDAGMRATPRSLAAKQMRALLDFEPLTESERGLFSRSR
jgi:2-polyprenyl-6-methoxyphenol hydroxylase-like FAD-dependent oxidoreductase